MGIAAGDFSGDGRPDLLREQLARPGTRRLPQPRRGRSRRPARLCHRPSARTSPAGATSWVDLNNDGNLDLVLANGAIPVTNLGEGRGPRAGAREPCSGQFANATGARRARPAGADERPRVSPRPTSTTTATSTSRSTRSAGRLLLLRSTRRLGPLARGEAAALRARARSSRPSCPDGRRLVARGRTRARATSRPRIRASTSGSAGRRGRALRVRYPDGADDAAPRRPGRPDRDVRAASALSASACGARPCRT